MFIVNDPSFREWVLDNVLYDEEKKSFYFPTENGIDIKLFDLIDGNMVYPEDENYRAYLKKDSEFLVQQ